MFLRKRCPRKTCAPHTADHTGTRFPNWGHSKECGKLLYHSHHKFIHFQALILIFETSLELWLGFQGKTLLFLMYCCSEKLLQAACHSMGNFQTSRRQIHDLFIVSRQLRKKAGKLHRTCQIILPRTRLNHIKKIHSLQTAAERSKYVS